MGEDLEDRKPPYNLFLQSRTHVVLEEQEKEKELPSFGRCRPLSRVADSGPKPKVNYPYISALPSLMIYPRMCGHVLEPDSRLGLSVPAGTLPVSGLPRRLRCFLGPRLPLQPPKELWQGSSLPREWPHQVGLTDAKINLAEVLPRRVRNLLGPRTSADYTLCFRRSQPVQDVVPDSRS